MKQIKQDGDKEWQKMLKQDKQVSKMAKKLSEKNKTTIKKSK